MADYKAAEAASKAIKAAAAGSWIGIDKLAGTLQQFEPTGLIFLVFLFMV